MLMTALCEPQNTMIRYRPSPKKTSRNHQAPNQTKSTRLLRARRVFGDGLCTLRHGVLGKLTRQNEAD